MIKMKIQMKVKILKKKMQNTGDFLCQIHIHIKIMNFIFKQIEVPNFIFPLGRLSYDYPQYQNKNNSFNIKINLLNFNFKNNILLNCI